MKIENYGDKNNKSLLIPPGMMNRSDYLFKKYLYPLTEKYYVLIPFYDGLYDESDIEFTTFEDQAKNRGLYY